MDSELFEERKKIVLDIISSPNYVPMKAKELAISVYRLVAKFPQYEQFALSNQLRRAAISIPSNIAEGSGRLSKKEKI